MLWIALYAGLGALALFNFGSLPGALAFWGLGLLVLWGWLDPE